MVSARFTVRPGQGGASGFDLGDMTVTGDLGTVESAGRVPDQSMMIHLSAVLLLDGLAAFLRDGTRAFRFAAADSSFGLTVRRSKGGVSVAGEKGVVAWTTAGELASAVLDAAEALGREHPLPADDPVAGDLAAALAGFRPLVPAGRGRR
ncbi:hypothetical protein ABZ990_14830 [Streptomyces sp. NPDC046203]|uniref:hypothetical protein n=1 Tax=Streptomyces sp. NPDC046203 TaxID=3154602 RepID=UPI0033F7356A